MGLTSLSTVLAKSRRDRNLELDQDLLLITNGTKDLLLAKAPWAGFHNAVHICKATIEDVDRVRLDPRPQAWQLGRHR